MDACLETGALLGLEEGEAHVIRNAGGVVSDDVIRLPFAMDAFSDSDEDIRQSIARIEASWLVLHKDAI